MVSHRRVSALILSSLAHKKSKYKNKTSTLHCEVEESQTVDSSHKLQTTSRATWTATGISESKSPANQGAYLHKENEPISQHRGWNKHAFPFGKSDKMQPREVVSRISNGNSDFHHRENHGIKKKKWNWSYLQTTRDTMRETWAWHESIRSIARITGRWSVDISQDSGSRVTAPYSRWRPRSRHLWRIRTANSRTITCTPSPTKTLSGRERSIFHQQSRQ